MPHVNFVSGTVAFTPASIAGLTLWYDMQNVASYTTSGAAITGLTDLSASANNATQPTSGDRFSYTASAINGHPAMSRTGSPATQKMILSNMKTIPCTIVVVGLWTSDDGNVFGGSSFNYYWPRINFGSYDIYADPGECGTTSGVTVNVGFVSMCVIPSTTATAQTNYRDNTLLTNSGGTSGTYNSSTNVIWLGGNSFNDANNFKGHIGEIVVYNSALGSTDRTNLYNYLKAKWGTP